MAGVQSAAPSACQPPPGMRLFGLSRCSARWRRCGGWDPERARAYMHLSSSWTWSFPADPPADLPSPPPSASLLLSPLSTGRSVTLPGPLCAIPHGALGEGLGDAPHGLRWEGLPPCPLAASGSRGRAGRVAGKDTPPAPPCHV